MAQDWEKEEEEEEMTYNHAISISFAVKGSKYGDPHDCVKYEKERIIGALLERIASLLNEESSEFGEAFSDFWDTYEEML